jgi:hypothetical protein
MPIVGGRSQNVMGTKVTADRVLTPTGAPKVDESDEGEPMSWDVGDRLLMVFAAFIALASSVSGLALLVVSIRSFVQ